MIKAQSPLPAKAPYAAGTKAGPASKHAAVSPLELNKYRAEVARLTSELVAAKELGERRQHLHAYVQACVDFCFVFVTLNGST
jgi:hypothetical protein